MEISNYFKRVVELNFNYQPKTKIFSIQFVLFFSLVFFALIFFVFYLCKQFLYSDSTDGINSVFSDDMLLLKIDQFVYTSLIISSALYAIYFKYKNTDEAMTMSEMFESIPSKVLTTFSLFIFINIFFSVLFYKTKYSASESFFFMSSYSLSNPYISIFIYKLFTFAQYLFPFVAVMWLMKMEANTNLLKKKGYFFLLICIIIDSVSNKIINIISIYVIYYTIQIHENVYYVLAMILTLFLYCYFIFTYVCNAFTLFEDDTNYSDSISADEVIEHLIDMK